MLSYPIGLKPFFIAITLSMTLLGGWEYAARRVGFGPWMEDGKDLWAQQRAKAEHAGPDDVVLTGSSRVLFDIQLDAWEKETGRRPIQLALPGSNALPVAKDIADNTSFAGTLVIGVTPGLYFSPLTEAISPWRRPMERVNHYYKRTYADKTGFWLSLPLQRTFAFLENDDDTFYNDLDLRTVIKRIPLKPRVDPEPPFPFFGYVDEDRNMTMLDRVVTDTAYAGMIKRCWLFFNQSRPNQSAEDMLKLRDASVQMSVEIVNKIRSRGGKVIFVRCPSSGMYTTLEKTGFPRATYWDELLKATGCKGYHYEDYELLNKYEPPEWSHLYTPDAKIFTRDLVRQMKHDGVL